MKALPDNSIDAVVTDPPYELGFLGKEWDRRGIAFSVELWQEVLRVLKPGGHLLSFGGSRTWHRIACAVEDAGFEIRDSIAWVYGQGFPKSLNIGKAIDKAAGAEREVTGLARAGSKARNGYKGDMAIMPFKTETVDLDITAPATEAAKKWDGWGTALKPAVEPIVVARKPPSEPTIAANVLKWDTGGLNIDGCRIATDEPLSGTGGQRKHHLLGDVRSRTGIYAPTEGKGYSAHEEGRFPANVILDEESATTLDEQSGASRFFYVAKAPQSERWLYCKTCGAVYPVSERANHEGHELNQHPTQKPLNLMRYLVRLVTPPDGTVLDPFTGSGTTGIACLLEGFDFIGFERDADYLATAKARLGNYGTTSQARLVI